MDTKNAEQKIVLCDREQLDTFPNFDADGEDKRLFEAIKNDNLILFYGAGLSRLAGCSGWIELAKNIIDKIPSHLYSKLDKIVLNEIAYADPKKAISICFHKVKYNEELTQKYFDTIRESVKPGNVKKFKEIHRKIFELNAISYITTNIDKGIESIDMLELKGKDICDLTSMKEDPTSKIRNGNIFYLHGTVDRIEKTVFTIDNYFKFYWENDKISGFLKAVFKDEYTVLFIGYGLDEYEILQNIFSSVERDSKYIDLYKHYWLSPTYSRDIARFNIEKEYLKIFSVKAIPYFIDYEGYDRLNYVLNLLINKTKDIKPDTLSVWTEIDQV